MYTCIGVAAGIFIAVGIWLCRLRGRQRSPTTTSNSDNSKAKKARSNDTHKTTLGNGVSNGETSEHSLSSVVVAPEALQEGRTVKNPLYGRRDSVLSVLSADADRNSSFSESDVDTQPKPPAHELLQPVTEAAAESENGAATKATPTTTATSTTATAAAPTTAATEMPPQPTEVIVNVDGSKDSVTAPAETPSSATPAGAPAPSDAGKSESDERKARMAAIRARRNRKKEDEWAMLEDALAVVDDMYKQVFNSEV